MLVLSRFRDQSVDLIIPEGCPPGTSIKVTIVDIRGAKVRLGFAAPDSVVILREELTYGGSKGGAA